MKKTLKLLTVILMTVMMVSMSTSMVFATDGVLSGIEGNINLNDAAAGAGDLTKLAGKVVGLIQIASVIAAVILVAVFGFNFIMGSAEQKSDYQKSFIPLIVGVVVVFSATSVARLLFGLLG